MARTDRLSVTVSPHMMVAIDHLCYRTGLSRASQAMTLLRQALDRTMQSEPVREALRRQLADQGVRARMRGESTEHFVERAYRGAEPVVREVAGNEQEAAGPGGAEGIAIPEASVARS